MKTYKKDLISFSIIFLLTLALFYNFLNMHYAGDTYYIINGGYENYAINRSLNDGRLFMCLIELFANAVHMPIQVFVILTLFFALLISCISVIVLKNIIIKYKPTKNKYLQILALVISYFTIFNFMYLENMYFVECIVMSASILFHIISADILVSRNKHYIIKSAFFTVISIFMYQGMVGFFLSITLLFSFLKNSKNIKEYIRDLISSGLISVFRNFT